MISWYFAFCTIRGLNQGPTFYANEYFFRSQQSSNLLHQVSPQSPLLLHSTWQALHRTGLPQTHTPFRCGELKLRLIAFGSGGGGLEPEIVLIFSLQNFVLSKNKAFPHLLFDAQVPPHSLFQRQTYFGPSPPLFAFSRPVSSLFPWFSSLQLKGQSCPGGNLQSIAGFVAGRAGSGCQCSCCTLFLCRSCEQGKYDLEGCQISC